MNQTDKEANKPVDFHGAAIINQQGQEVPITEEMIKKACEKLEQEDSQKKAG